MVLVVACVVRRQSDQLATYKRPMIRLAVDSVLRSFTQMWLAAFCWFDHGVLFYIPAVLNRATTVVCDESGQIKFPFSYVAHVTRLTLAQARLSRCSGWLTFAYPNYHFCYNLYPKGSDCKAVRRGGAIDGRGTKVAQGPDG